MWKLLVLGWKKFEFFFFHILFLEEFLFVFFFFVFWYYYYLWSESEGCVWTPVLGMGMGLCRVLMGEELSYMSRRT